MYKPPKFRPTKKMIEAAKACFIAIAHLKTIEPVVLGYQKKILQENNFLYSMGPHSGEKITEPQSSYMMSNENFDMYLELNKIERERLGMAVMEKDYCPLNIAQNKARGAKLDLVNIMEPFTGIDGYSVINYSLEAYDKIVELTLNLFAAYFHENNITVLDINQHKEIN